MHVWVTRLTGKSCSFSPLCIEKRSTKKQESGSIAQTHSRQRHAPHLDPRGRKPFSPVHARKVETFFTAKNVCLFQTLGSETSENED